MSDDDLSDKDRDALLRWRLALGPEAERVSPRFGLGGLAGGAGDLEIDANRLGDLDQSLSFVYEDRTGGIGPSRPYIPKWLA